ncbi:MAG: ABC transporter substrate-binding protein [Planctomycetota bacterium]|nr:ABC transporter substrate-binding protein [Planctomycetota bacterium]
MSKFWFVFAASLLILSCSHESTPGSALGGVEARRIVCGNAAAAEFVCRLVAPERVVGLPEQADDYVSINLKTGGFERATRFSRYVTEALIALGPDLVVTHEWQNADTTNILRSQGIRTIVLKSATSYEDIRATLVDLGTQLGATARANEIANDLDTRIEKLRSTAGTRSTLRALIYTNDGTGGSTAGANTTADTMIRLSGMKNAAADAGLISHVTLDFERLLAIDPDVIIVSKLSRGDGGSPTRVVLESSSALASLRARKLGRIVEISAVLMSADSPPLVDAAELVASAVDSLLAEKR